MGYVPKDEESTNSASSSPSTPVVNTVSEEPIPSIENSPAVAQNIQEVNANVFADTCNISMSSSASNSSTPKYMPSEHETLVQGSPQMPIYNGFDCAFVDHMGMSPPGSLSTPTFIPAIPTPMMFPMPYYAPQYPTEFVYQDLAQQPVPQDQQPMGQQYSEYC